MGLFAFYFQSMPSLSSRQLQWIPILTTFTVEKMSIQTSPKSLLQHYPIPLSICMPSVLQTVIFSPKIWLNTQLPSIFLYNVTAHFPLWWKTLVSHKILRLLITLAAIPKPSFTKHSLKQSQQQSNENMKNVGKNPCNKCHVFMQWLIISTTKSVS